MAVRLVLQSKLTVGPTQSPFGFGNDRPVQTMDMLSYYMAAEEDMVSDYAHRVLGRDMLSDIRKLYVTGHMDREAFARLLHNYNMTPMQICEFIDVADDSRERYEREQQEEHERR